MLSRAGAGSPEVAAAIGFLPCRGLCCSRWELRQWRAVFGARPAGPSCHASWCCSSLSLSSSVSWSSPEIISHSPPFFVILPGELVLVLRSWVPSNRCFLFLLSLTNARDFLTDFSCCFPSSELCLQSLLVLVVLPYFSRLPVLLCSLIFAVISFWRSILPLYFFFSAFSVLSDHGCSLPLSFGARLPEAPLFSCPFSSGVNSGSRRRKTRAVDDWRGLCAVLQKVGCRGAAQVPVSSALPGHLQKIPLFKRSGTQLEGWWDLCPARTPRHRSATAPELPLVLAVTLFFSLADSSFFGVFCFVPPPTFVLFFFLEEL